MSEPEVMSSSCAQTHTHFIYYHNDKEKQHILTFKKLEPENVLIGMTEIMNRF